MSLKSNVRLDVVIVNVVSYEGKAITERLDS